MKLIQKDYEEGYHESFLLRERSGAQRIRQRLALLRSLRPEGGLLLEVGVGQGGLLRAAASYFSVEGIDISRRAIAALKAEFGERVRQADITREALPAGHYDAITIFNVLEHLQEPGGVLGKLHAALSAGGVILGSMPNCFGLVGGLATRIGNFFDRTHISTFSPAVWRALFTQAGFLDTEFFGELMLGPNAALYLRRRWWPYVSFNLMFVSHKSGRPA